MSAVVFCLFTFSWLYFFQGYLFAVAQHMLSGGQTHYDRLIGASVITAVLWLLQLLVYFFVRLRNSLHVLTYIPSLLLLAFICSVSSDDSQHYGLGAWLWALPLLLVLWGAITWVARSLLQFEAKGKRSFFSRSMWVNMIVMAIGIAAVVSVSNTNAVFYYRAHMEDSLLRNRLDEALNTGCKSLESDASLTMLRAYVLSQRGELGGRLFEYAVSGTGADLVPLDGNHSRLLHYPVDSLYRHLGAVPRPGMTTADYLQALQRSGQATPAVADYVLCSLLIDRNLDAFARTISRYYQLSDSVSLPRHYREALTLYTHQHAHPAVVYHHPVTEEDYANLQELKASYPDSRQRKVKVLEDYFGSYWYYYEFMR
jgi:hypothetical protein